jgi:hypothetical protein
MAPSVTETVQQVTEQVTTKLPEKLAVKSEATNGHDNGVSANGNDELPALKTGHSKPLELSGALDQFSAFDVTPVIGREFGTDANLADWIQAPNSDELLRDLAITSTQSLYQCCKTLAYISGIQSHSAALSSSASRTTSPTTSKRCSYSAWVSSQVNQLRLSCISTPSTMPAASTVEKTTRSASYPQSRPRSCTRNASLPLASGTVARRVVESSGTRISPSSPSRATMPS